MMLFFFSKQSSGARVATMLCAISSFSTATAAVSRNEVTKSLQKVIRDKQCGPIFLRLAWHDAGTYDIKTNTGGPRACQRFDVGESTHGANNGLQIARGLLEPVKKAHPEIGYADLWSLAAVVAVKEMGGPTIQWRSGRVDAAAPDECVEEGRLPDAQQKGSHLRSVFHRMGLDDQTIVALSGAHTLGRFHKERSGHVGDWTTRPFNFDNSYFVDLVDEKWTSYVNEDGNTQYKCPLGTAMAPSDIALVEDPKFKVWVQLYADDQERFFADFAASCTKLFELGVPAFHGSAAGKVEQPEKEL